MIAPAAGRARDLTDDLMTVPAVHLVVPASSKNVSLIRHTISGLGEALGIDDEALANLKTVVTEACTNAVLHAYDEGEAGVIEVRAAARQDAVEIIVRDFGHGFRPRAVNPEAAPSLRLGLPLIAALSSEFELRAAPGGGTEVVMLMPLTREAAEDGSEAQMLPAARPGEAIVTVDDGELASAIVSRVVSSLAARADLPVDRLSDALLLSDALSSEGGAAFVEGRTRVAVEESAGAITLRVGPLLAGTGEQMLAALDIPGLDASLRSLADDALVEHTQEGEHVTLRIAGS